MLSHIKEKFEGKTYEDFVALIPKYHDYRLSVRFNRGADMIGFYLTALLDKYDIYYSQLPEPEKKKQTGLLIKEIFKDEIDEGAIDVFFENIKNLKYKDHQELLNFAAYGIRKLNKDVHVTRLRPVMNIGVHEPKGYYERLFTIE